MTNVIIGDTPRPWVFTIGMIPDWKLSQDIEQLFPTVTPVDYIRHLRQTDYDAVVGGHTAQPNLAPQLQVVWFSDYGEAPVKMTTPPANGGRPPTANWVPGDRAARFECAEAAVEEAIVPLVMRLSPEASGQYHVLRKTAWLTQLCHPLVVGRSFVRTQ